MAPSLLTPFFLPITVVKGYARLCMASISLAIEATKLVDAALTPYIVKSDKKHHKASVQAHQAFSSRPAVKDVSLVHVSSTFSTSSASSTHTMYPAAVSLSTTVAAKSVSEPAVLPVMASLATSPLNFDSNNAYGIATPVSPTLSLQSSSSTSSSTSIPSSRSKAGPLVSLSPWKAPRLLSSSASRTKTIALEHALTAAVAEGRFIDGELYYAAKEHVLARIEVEEPHERRTEVARTFTPVYPAGSFEAAEELRARNIRLTERIHSLLDDYLDSRTSDPTRKPKEQATPRLAGTVVDHTVYSTPLVNLSSIRRSLGRQSKRIARRPGFHLSSPIRREVLEWAAVETAHNCDSIICVDSSIDDVDASFDDSEIDDSEIDELEKVNVNEEGVQAAELVSATPAKRDWCAEADDEDDEEYFRNPPVFPSSPAQIAAFTFVTDKHHPLSTHKMASATEMLDWSTELFDNDDEYFRCPPTFR